jgi:hypothetical protein
MNRSILTCLALHFALSGCAVVRTTTGGSVNQLAKFDASADITNSQIYDNGTNVGVGNTNPTAKLDVSGSFIGIQGTASGPNGLAVYGVGTARGVEGDVSNADGIGVFGASVATTGTAFGVLGQAVSSSGIAVLGNALGTSGDTRGVLGAVQSPSGHGVRGQSFAASCSGSIVPCGVGVYGQGVVNGSGVYGTLADASGFVGSAGIWGDTGNSGWAVLGTARDGTAMAALNNSASVATMFMANAEKASSGSPVLSVIGENFGGVCIIDVSGNLTCTGAKNAAVPIDGGHIVALSAVEAPGNWFEDFGSGKLSNGSATVTLAADFAKTVNASVEYQRPLRGAKEAPRV